MRSVLCLFFVVAIVYSAAIKPNEQTGNAKVKDAIMCDACKDIVDDVENQTEDTIEARVNASIQNHCNNLGFLAGECKKVMTEVEDKVVENINDNYSADQICQMVDIC